MRNLLNLNHRSIGVMLISQLFLAGCTVGPDFAKSAHPAPKKWNDLPSLRHNQTAAHKMAIAETAMDRQWWRQFKDPFLSSLIESALKKNLSLQTALALLAQSRAQQGIAAADQFPLLNGNASYTRMLPSQKGILGLSKTLSGGAASHSGSDLAASANGTGAGALAVPAAGIKPFSLYQYGFDASWEVDLWGRVRREQEAAEAGVEAAQEGQYGAQVSIVAEVARNYIQLRRLQNARTVAIEQCDIAAEIHDLVSRKVARGLATAIDEETAKADLTDAQAQLPLLDKQIEQTLNALDLLLNSLPGAMTAQLKTPAPLPSVSEQAPIGLPTELALRRPDIREAEANLHKALAEIGMAEADFYPRFTLAGSAGLQSLRLEDLANWSARQYAIGPSLTLPIFQGGRLEATFELRQATHQQAAIAYQTAVLGAWNEIDNSIDAYLEAQRRQQDLQASQDAKTEVLNLQQHRFQQGITDILPLLKARSALLQAKVAVTDGQGDLATGLVALYKSLGGGWQPVNESHGEK